ncbi:MAG TPA: Fe-S cluster assembly protein SufD [Thermoanaerobaculia bacterium]|nr:Fe-S cluster assembly protein SufD [Thermoanaerobaculia bacterium]
MTTAVDADVRERAAEAWEKLGWPTTRIEEWRYTNLAPLQRIAWKTDDAPQFIETPETLAGKAALELVFVNGKLLRQTGDTRFVNREVNVAIADWERNALVALNTAHAQDGARIEIAPNAIVDGFLHLLFVGNGDGVWSHPRNVIRVGSNAQVTIVETYVGSGNYFTNAVTEIVAGDGAVVDHYRVQCEGPGAFHIGNVFIREERSATVTSRSIALGSALARHETHVTLAGTGANVVLDGLFAGTGTQHLDNRTVIDHVEPHCESHELYKGILDQNARGVFDGRIIVRPGAQKTVSRQENRNLLLSESAIVDSKPTLEIHNDDVKCNHGSTIGQLNDEALFYLRSRGISEEESRGLLVFAFASEIVDRMKLEPVREQIRRALFRQMPERMPERRGGAR